MILAGDEFHRTQRGNNNGYCQDNEISWVNWNLGQGDWDLVDLCATLRHLRKNYAAILPGEFFTGQPLSPRGPKDLAWFGPDSAEITEWTHPESPTVGMFISSDAGGSLLTILNAAPDSVEFLLPGSPYAAEYEPILDTTFTNGKPAKKHYFPNQPIVVTARSVVVLIAQDHVTNA
jgi:glycogen operon protein